MGRYIASKRRRHRLFQASACRVGWLNKSIVDRQIRVRSASDIHSIHSQFRQKEGQKEDVRVYTFPPGIKRPPSQGAVTREPSQRHNQDTKNANSSSSCKLDMITHKKMRRSEILGESRLATCADGFPKTRRSRETLLGCAVSQAS